jgi:hypothetical protein
LGGKWQDLILILSDATIGGFFGLIIKNDTKYPITFGKEQETM